MIQLGSWSPVLPLDPQDVVIQLSSALTFSVSGQGTGQVAEGGPRQQQRWRRRGRREWDPAEWDSRECRDLAWKPRGVKRSIETQETNSQDWQSKTCENPWTWTRSQQSMDNDFVATRHGTRQMMKRPAAERDEQFRQRHVAWLKLTCSRLVWFCLHQPFFIMLVYKSTQHLQQWPCHCDELMN